MKFKMNIKAVSVLAVVALGALHSAYAQVDSTGISALRGTPRLEAAAPIQNQGGGTWHPVASNDCQFTGPKYVCKNNYGKSITVNIVGVAPYEQNGAVELTGGGPGAKCSYSHGTGGQSTCTTNAIVDSGAVYEIRGGYPKMIFR